MRYDTVRTFGSVVRVFADNLKKMKKNKLLNSKNQSQIFETAKKRNPYIDLARGIAALIVVSWHVRGGNSVTDFNVINIHYLVVDFFFLISGFVLFDQIAKISAGQLSPALFLWKRFIRLWPLMFIVVVAALLVKISQSLCLGTTDGVSTAFECSAQNISTWLISENGWLSWLSAALMLQIAVEASIFWCAPLWSLSAIWWANVVSAFTSRVGRLSNIWILFGVGFILLAIGFVLDRAFIDYYGEIWGISALGRALIGFNGGLIIRNHLNNKSYQSTTYIWILSVVALVVFMVIDRYSLAAAAFVSPICLAPLLVALASQPDAKLTMQMRSWFLWAGKLSFPVFIWHRVVLEIYYGASQNIPILGQATSTHFVPRYLLILSCTILISIVSLQFLEPRLRRWLETFGNRFFSFTRTPVVSQTLT